MKPKKFKITCKTQGAMHTLEFIVDQADAHIVRAHKWMLKKRAKPMVAFTITRKGVENTDIPLAHDILQCSVAAKTYHINNDSTDFRRENLAISKYDNEHCKYGHPWSEENTYFQPSGNRVCKTCAAANARKHYQKMKEMRA